MCETNGDFDVDEALWVPGVDYIAGWREAKAAGAELVSALSAAWPDAEGVTAVAQSAADGSGTVRLRLPAATARALAQLIISTTTDQHSRPAAS